MAKFEQIKAWQLAHRRALRVYRLTRKYPADERYGLTSQTRRAAYSVAAHLAEGSARRGPREFRRFIDIGHSSLVELRYALFVARDLQLVADEEWQGVDELRDEVGCVMWARYRSMDQSADGPP